jgi:RimJ/RimL family protein N-acetyltransferase
MGTCRNHRTQPMISEPKSNHAKAEIETARLRLRKFSFDDAPFFVVLLNDPDWIRFIGDRNVHNEEEARAYMAKAYMAQYENMGFGLYLVERRGDGCAIGMCGLIKRDGLDDVDIGFAFLPEYRGEGYAEEAARATIVYGQEVLKLAHIVGIATPDNQASISLMQKIGMRFERTTQLESDAKTLAVYGVHF